MPRVLTSVIRSATILLSCWLAVPPAVIAGQAAQTSAPLGTGATLVAREPTATPGYPHRIWQSTAGRPAAGTVALGNVAGQLSASAQIGTIVPNIRAAAAVVYHPATGEVLWGENVDAQRSIASITKLMTATVFVEDLPDLEQVVRVARADVRRASTTYLRRNDRIKTRELLHLLLIGSDNAAARVLARVSPWGTAGFIERMNEKARALGLAHTRFTDPSGLDAGNVSSAYELSRLLVHASTNQILAPIMQIPRYRLAIGRRTVRVRNTNRLLDGELDIQAGKTGFIRAAGYCLATLLRLPQGSQVAVVVLGARSNRGRFSEARRIINWISAKAQELLDDTPVNRLYQNP